VLGRPILSRAPLESKCEYWYVAFDEAAQFLRILGDGEHEICEIDPFPTKIATFSLAGQHEYS
jgi:hypothetical protein